MRAPFEHNRKPPADIKGKLNRFASIVVAKTTFWLSWCRVSNSALWSQNFSSSFQIKIWQHKYTLRLHKWYAQCMVWGSEPYPGCDGKRRWAQLVELLNQTVCRHYGVMSTTTTNNGHFIMQRYKHIHAMAKREEVLCACHVTQAFLLFCCQ